MWWCGGVGWGVVGCGGVVCRRRYYQKAMARMSCTWESAKWVRPDPSPSNQTVSPVHPRWDPGPPFELGGILVQGPAKANPKAAINIMVTHPTKLRTSI